MTRCPSFPQAGAVCVVAGYLEHLGIAFKTGVGTTGVVGIIDGGADGPTVEVRAVTSVVLNLLERW